MSEAAVSWILRRPWTLGWGAIGWSCFASLGRAVLHELRGEPGPEGPVVPAPAPRVPEP